MTDPVLPDLSISTFLQLFITQSIRLAGLQGDSCPTSRRDHIRNLGLSVSLFLEAKGKQQLGLPEKLTREQYALLITYIKNQIGGDFHNSPQERAVCVTNYRCPFGDNVKDAPELCQMTSAVFGAIAARNFGYAKVELKKRIAANDDRCDVRIHTDRSAEVESVCDEYENEGGAVLSRCSSALVATRAAQTIARIWSPNGSAEKQGADAIQEIVAESYAMREALDAVELAAPTAANILISGETGVGKEIIARAVHALSSRSDQKFLAVNCGAIPDNLIESALFGHERGAFTGAHVLHRGYFERAAGGTLFLDEIDNLPLLSQANLLRVLQEGEFERVGGKHMLRSDVRIIAASNRTLETLVAEGSFRKDLYYRLNVVPIHIPPLRDRREDIAPLVINFLKRLAARYQTPQRVLGDLAWKQIMGYRWPGNVRELENVLERAYIFAKTNVIGDVGVRAGEDAESMSATPCRDLRARKQMAASEVEVKGLQDALARHRGRVNEVAKEIGITSRGLRLKLKKHNIAPAAYR
jgi:transcriptional regulator with PAS, ATPase and Fis domain